MRITVSKGVGTGPTTLAAFDTALLEAGVGNYNLIPLSSVIPRGSRLVRDKFVAPENEYGHRLYVVLSQQEADVVGQEAWAGVGWIQDNSGKGLFVEHHGTSREKVKQAIHDSLRHMTRKRQDYVDCPFQFEIAGIRCESEPVSAVAIAVYSSQGWSK